MKEKTDSPSDGVYRINKVSRKNYRWYPKVYSFDYVLHTNVPDYL